MRPNRMIRLPAATAIAVVLLCSGNALAQKSGKGGSGGGDSATPTGVVYYYYTPELISMDANGAHKSIVGLGIGDAVPSFAEHGGQRWFLQGYNQLTATSEANTTVTLYTVPSGAAIEQQRWFSDPVGGTDAYVSWYEPAAGNSGMTAGVLIRAPVIYGGQGQVTGLDFSSAEYIYGVSWDYDWSPDGTSVVYRDENELWVYDTATKQHAILPTSIAFQPRWSPDGTRIVYGARAENWTAIEVFRLDDLSVTAIAKARNRGVNGKYVDRPSWSPDGKFILYRHLDASGYNWYYDIMRCTPDGQSPANLTGDVTMSFYAHSLIIVGWCLE